jgi:Lrp/AsnC family leucine-responsive transcriptional regulator
MKIDETDMRILQELKKNARLSMRELGKKVNLSPPSVSERVKRLEDQGVIEGYTISINRKKLGFAFDCLIEVTIKNGDYRRFQQYIERHSRAIFCYRITGESCYMVKLSVVNLKEIEDFINDVCAFAKTVSHIVISEVELQSNLNWQLPILQNGE